MAKYLSQNIKYLREERQVTQEKLARIIGKKKSVIGAYEKGQAEPTVDNLIRISNYFGISIDNLIQMDLTSPSSKYKLTSSLETLKEPRPEYKIVAVSKNQDQENQISIVPISEYANYAHSYDNPEYIATLNTCEIPIDYTGIFRAFEVESENMEPTLQRNDLVVGKFTEVPAKIRNNKIYMLLMKDYAPGIYRVRSINDDIEAYSDNSTFDSIIVPKEAVVEAWEITTCISTQIGAGKDIQQKLMSIEKRLDEMSGNH